MVEAQGEGNNTGEDGMQNHRSFGASMVVARIALAAAVGLRAGRSESLTSTQGRWVIVNLAASDGPHTFLS